MTHRLTYFPGSPFARMARVLVIEWALPVEPVPMPFPADGEMFEETPLGQVPALLPNSGTPVLTTLLVLERLWEMAGRPDDAYRPETDRQTLQVALQAGDAFVTAKYIDWTGLRPTAPNVIGYDMAARGLERFRRTLDWLSDGRLRHGITLPGVAAAALVLWADARGGGHEPVPEALRALADALAGRPSFRQTVPQVWSPGD